MKKKCILITGMHRSGTSALAGVIHNLGIAYGADLLAAEQENPKGFFENQTILELNRLILELFDSNWYDLKKIDYQLIVDKKEYQKIFKVAVSYIKKISKQEVFAMKDPRFCLTLPFWEDLFKQLDIDYVCIASLRHPVETIRSLRKRNDFSEMYSALLYGKYMLHFGENTLASRRICISFDALIKEPTIIIRELVSFFQDHEINLSPSTTQIQFIENTFLDKRLKHHNTDLPSSASFPPTFFKIHNYFIHDSLSSSSETTLFSLTQEYSSLLEQYLSSVEEFITAILFYKTTTKAPFLESKKLLQQIRANGSKQIVSFDLRKLEEKIKELRVDLTDRLSVIKIEKVELHTSEGRFPITYRSNAAYEFNNELTFLTNDPNLYFEIPPKMGKLKQIDLHFNLMAWERSTIVTYLKEHNISVQETSDSVGNIRIDGLSVRREEGRGFIKQLFYFPRVILTLLNKENIGKLRRALAQEPLSVILGNVLRRFFKRF